MALEQLAGGGGLSRAWFGPTARCGRDARAPREGLMPAVVYAGKMPALPGIVALRPEPLSCGGVVNPTMRVWNPDPSDWPMYRRT